jgi:fibronectin type 3 domain-containing protein
VSCEKIYYCFGKLTKEGDKELMMKKVFLFFYFCTVFYIVSAQDGDGFDWMSDPDDPVMQMFREAQRRAQQNSDNSRPSSDLDPPPMWGGTLIEGMFVLYSKNDTREAVLLRNNNRVQFTRVNPSSSIVDRFVDGDKRADFQFGESAQSDVVSAVTHIPPPDTIHAVPASTSSIDVTWSQVIWANNYKLYRSTNENGPYDHIATTAELSYSDAVLDNTLKYFYKVSAVSTAGESVLSVYASAEFKLPNPPSGLSAVSLSSTSLEISWDSVQGASGYKLYHSNTTATGTYNLIATVNDTNYTHSGLTINTDYWYKVSATNIIGEGAQSAYINARIAPPPTPANVRVEPLSHTSLRVSWDPVPGALLYSVYRPSSMITSTTDTYYIDTGLDPFRQYGYRVSATNDIGTGALTAASVSAYTQPIPLEEGVWYSRTTYASYSYNGYYYDYYSFPVNGGNYFIQWGYVGHTQETSTYNQFSAYWSSTNSMTNLSTAYFTDQTGGLANPRRVQPPNSGYIIIRVRNNRDYYYDLRFYKE